MSEGAASLAAPSPVDLAWIAGIHEGEGTAYLHRRTTGKGDQAYTNIAIVMTDKWVIERLHKLLGFGRIYGPYKRVPTKFESGRSKQLWKVTYQWRATKKDDVTRFYDLVRPLLSPRRKQQLDECILADTRLADPS